MDDSNELFSVKMTGLYAWNQNEKAKIENYTTELTLDLYYKGKITIWTSLHS